MCSSGNVEQEVGVEMIKILNLCDFEGHPFKVECNQDLFELSQSIEREGIIVPLIVREKVKGKKYEILSGHRRKAAAKWAGLEEVYRND